MDLQLYLYCTTIESFDSTFGVRSHVQPASSTPVTVKVKVVPDEGLLTLLDIRDTTPLVLVTPESKSEVAPLQLPDTITPCTGNPPESTIIMVAKAVVLRLLILKFISMFTMCMKLLSPFVSRSLTESHASPIPSSSTSACSDQTGERIVCRCFCQNI